MFSSGDRESKENGVEAILCAAEEKSSSNEVEEERKSLMKDDRKRIGRG
jgi:hypothetical protein